MNHAFSNFVNENKLKDSKREEIMRRAKLLKLEICTLEIIRKVKSKCLKKTKITKIIKYLLGFLGKLKL